MKRIYILLITILTSVVSGVAQDKPAYWLYNNEGKQVKYDKMVNKLADSDMVFFGEYHQNPISHWLQIELTKSLFDLKGDKLFLGAEMFENGNQLVLNEYLAGFYDEKKMFPELTQLWTNYKTDYKPLVEFAKENELRFIATNIPRRYASMINKKGIECLQEISPEALAMIGPELNDKFDTLVYADMKDAMGEHVPPNMLNIQTAQAAKDATMAHFSLKNHNEGDLLLHFQGAYHSNYYRGIIWWINQYKPGYNIKSITTLDKSEWDEMSDEDKTTIADYIIVVPDNMTKTYRK